MVYKRCISADEIYKGQIIESNGGNRDVYALQNGADLDYGNVRAKMFDAKCPDECRVSIHGEIMED